MHLILLYYLVHINSDLINELDLNHKHYHQSLDLK